MVPFQTSLVCLSSLALASSSHAGAVEEAVLKVTINPGFLEIAPASVNGSFTPTSGAVSVTGTEQADAVTFEIPNILVNDLNGDGLGWKLTASPGNLSNENESVIPVGTVTGFVNPSDQGGTLIQTPNNLLYTSGSGVANYTVDYGISYTVPAEASAGDYSGKIVFTVSAQ